MKRLIVALFCGSVASAQIVSMSIGSPVFTDAGFAGDVAGGAYVGVRENHQYGVSVCTAGTPDTVQFNRDGGAYTGCTAATGSAQALSYPAGTLATCTWTAARASCSTTAAHGMKDGALVTIAGASPSGYNVAGLPVVVSSSTAFSFALVSNPGAYVSGGVVTASDGLTVRLATTGHTAAEAWSVMVTSHANPPSFVGAGVGARSRTSEDKARETVSALDYCQQPDGTASNSVCLQAGVDYLNSVGGGMFVIPATAQCFMHNAGIQVYSNITINLEAGSCLKRVNSQPGGCPLYGCLAAIYSSILSNVNNVHIVGAGTIDGNRVNNGPPSYIGAGGAADGIWVSGWKNSSVEGVSIVNQASDGIGIFCSNTAGLNSYTALNTSCGQNVLIAPTVVSNATRNGITFSGGSGFTFRGRVTGTNGIAPQAGIDMEPDFAGQNIINMDIDGLETDGNAGTGISFGINYSTADRIRIRAKSHDNGVQGVVLGLYPCCSGTLTAASWSAGVATFTTSSSNNFATGNVATITSALPAGYNLIRCIVTVLSTTQFTCPLASNPGSYASGGTVLGTYAQAVITNVTVEGAVSGNPSGGVILDNENGSPSGGVTVNVNASASGAAAFGCGGFAGVRMIGGAYSGSPYDIGVNGCSAFDASGANQAQQPGIIQVAPDPTQPFVYHYSIRNVNTTALFGAYDMICPGCEIRMQSTDSAVSDMGTWGIRVSASTGNTYLQFRSINDARTTFIGKMWLWQSGCLYVGLAISDCGAGSFFAEGNAHVNGYVQGNAYKTGTTDGATANAVLTSVCTLGYVTGLFIGQSAGCAAASAANLGASTGSTAPSITCTSTSSAVPPGGGTPTVTTTCTEAAHSHIQN